MKIHCGGARGVSLERWKKYCSHAERGFLGVGEALAKAQVRSNPVTEPKRSQNPKRPLSIYLFPRGYSIFENALALAIGIAISSNASAQTNSWTDPTSGNWEDSSWSLGVLPGANQTILITNAGWKAVAIGPNTAANFPQTLNVGSVTISAPTNSSNLLLLNYAGVSSPLIADSVTLNENSAITMYSSALQTTYMSIGGTFNQDYFSGVSVHVLQIGDVGPGMYAMSNGTLTVTTSETLGGWGYPAVFDQEGGYHYATPLHINGGGEYDLRGGQLGGEVQMTGGVLNQYGGDLAVDTFEVDGYYNLLDGTFEAPNGLTVDLGYMTQAGGTNTGGSFLLGIVGGSLYSEHSGYTMSNGVMNLTKATINFTGTLDQEGGVINISGPLNIPANFVGPGPGYWAYGYFVLNGGTFSASSIGPCVNMSQNGGTNIVTGDLDVQAPDCVCVLTGGLLSTSNTTVFDEGVFIQRGGVHRVQNLLRVSTRYNQNYTISGGQIIAPWIEVTLPGSINHAGGTISNSAGLILDAGGWGEQTTGVQFGVLQLANAYGPESSISLPSGPCVMHFLASSGQVWSNNATLQIAGWTGSLQGGGQSQVIFGNDASGLSPSQLAQIQFAFPQGNLPAKILSSGEIVPDPGTMAIIPQGGGNMQINFAGAAGHNYEFDVSTDLLHWTSWITQQNTSGTISIGDAAAVNYPVRFYRVIPLP